MLNMLIMGPAGSGKGTMSERLKAHYQVAHISTGDMFRAEIKNNTDLGQLASSFITAGKLVPDEVTIAMVKKRISEKDCMNGYLLDGYPRSLVQAIAFDELVNGTERKLDVVINLTIDEEKLIQRIENRRLCKTCGAIYNLLSKPSAVEGICDVCGSPLYQRADDNRESLLVRMEAYRNQTEPVLDHYKALGIVIDINADQAVDEVWNELKNALDPYLG